MKAAPATKPDSIEVEYKRADGEVVKTAWSDLDTDAVIEGRPWRTFPWYLGQRNYSGLYWCATERAMVGYESRLERNGVHGVCGVGGQRRQGMPGRQLNGELHA